MFFAKEHFSFYLDDSTQLDDFAPRRFCFSFGHSPQNWKHRLITGVAFQIGQIDEQIGFPLRRFGDGPLKSVPPPPLNLNPRSAFVVF